MDRELNIKLVKAVSSGNFKLIKSLLMEGANPNQYDSGSPLISDVFFYSDRNTETHQITDFLITHGADVNALDDDGLPPMFDAILMRDAYLVEALLKAGANPNAILEGIETLYDYANHDYRLMVFDLKEPKGPEDEDEYLNFLFDYAEQQQLERPDYLRVMRQHGCKTLQELNKESE